MAAGAAGDAKAVDGVAGESNMLPWEEAGLSQGFSMGRYCTHGFLLLETREPVRGRKDTSKLHFKDPVSRSPGPVVRFC